MSIKLSLIVTTYNWPEALAAVLDSVKQQQTLPHEVVIADDGSRQDTVALIDEVKQNFPCGLVHVWHKDQGYRAAEIRNKAAVAASGDYLVFIDGDCLLRPDFIAQHLRLAKQGSFVAGNRVLLSKEFTESVLGDGLDITSRAPFHFSSTQVNRRWSLFRFPLGLFRTIKRRRWQGVKGCNMALFRSDFIKCNGFEEDFKGWGYEDSDLIVRLLKNGLQRISGRFAVTVLHLWHNTNKGEEEESNWERFQQTIKGERTRSKKGLDQHI